LAASLQLFCQIIRALGLEPLLESLPQRLAVCLDFLRS
jgi:hypothetical protein